MTVRILAGDCREVMRTLDENSVDAIVTDPPYELTRARPGGRSEATRGKVMGGFMGMQWDGTGVAFDVTTWTEALRVLKPGGYLLAFSGTRTYHRMVVAIEDAGFEIRDQIGWVFGSGFPKSHNGPWGGTALKPAWEPVCMARKPLAGTVEANWREHGTGALNIDACRIEAEPMPPNTGKGAMLRRTVDEVREPRPPAQPHDLGRWPANLIHDGSDEVLAAFPAAPGAMAPVTGREPSSSTASVYGTFKRAASDRTGEASADSNNEGAVGFKMKPGARRIDTGSAARFFAQFKQEAPCSPSSVATAPPNSSLQSELAASAASAAATWPSLAGILSSDSPATSTNVTPSESRTLREIVTAVIASIGSGFSREQLLEKRTQCGSLVSVAAESAPTGTMTITASLSRSDGCAEAATLSITPTPLDRGAQDCARFKYCAKADRADRNEGLQDPGPQFKKGSTLRDAENLNAAGERKGNHHPTVKPTDLMRYLCRLVTPAGGVVLDPFMGSGSTLKAAELEGFAAIGIELDPDYIAIARRRISADAPLFAEVA